MEEQWKDIPGYERHYQASNQGRIRSLILKKPKILKQYQHPESSTSPGYREIRLSEKKHWVHRLVILTFVGSCPEGMNVDHLNGIHYDNRLENLQYLEISTNSAQGALHGERNGSVKLTTKEVREIRTLAGLLTCKAIAALFPVSANMVNRIIKRKNWKHV